MSRTELEEVQALLERVLPDPSGFAGRLLKQAMGHKITIGVPPTLTLGSKAITGCITAAAFDKNGHPLPGTQFTWNSSPNDQLTVAPRAKRSDHLHPRPSDHSGRTAGANYGPGWRDYRFGIRVSRHCLVDAECAVDPARSRHWQRQPSRGGAKEPTMDTEDISRCLPLPPPPHTGNTSTVRTAGSAAGSVTVSMWWPGPASQSTRRRGG